MKTKEVLSCILVSLCILVCGCTNINQFHTYIARNPEKGELSLFRVTIKGHSEMSNFNYKADWRPAYAVDEIFKDVKAPVGGDPNEDNYAKIREMQKTLVKEITDELPKSWTKDEPQNIERNHYLEQRLSRALALERKIRASQTSGFPDAPAEKYVIAISADPDKIFNEIQSVVTRQATEGAMIKTLDVFLGENARKDSQALSQWKQLLEDNYSELKIDVTLGDAKQQFEKGKENLEKYIQNLQTFLEVTE